ncbi:MAG: acyltransferase family protein [Devosia sp.]|uniref:acyltransferase family protein n=1 Tax=Devosia sp. TaxID=1871048 RepID=UPI0024C73545|nr:acyltransferase family protein [Devosia sp.]UYO00058.1 MAG: acyltransferase family protein [Devosia sp.]
MSSPPGSSTSTTRSAYIDNLKAILITLVVFGHIVEIGFKADGANSEIYRLIYTFHMPAFVFVSGYLSSKDRFGTSWALSFLTPISVYIPFQFLYSSLDITFSGRSDLIYYLVRPYWLMWYLLSLAIWRAFLPFLRVTNISIPLSIGVAILAGFVVQDGGELSIGRTIFFLPFFLVGYRLRNTDLAPQLSVWRVCAALAVLLLILLMFFGPAHEANVRWLFGREGYFRLKEPEWGGAYRLAVYLVAAAGVWSILQVTPSRAGWWTEIGRQSLSAYVWHGFFIRALILTGVSAWGANLPFAVVATCIILGVSALPWVASLANAPIFLLQHLFSATSSSARSGEHG